MERIDATVSTKKRREWAFVKRGAGKGIQWVKYKLLPPVEEDWNVTIVYREGRKEAVLKKGRREVARLQIRGDFSAEMFDEFLRKKGLPPFFNPLGRRANFSEEW